MKIKPLALGLALGIVWGASLLVMGFMSMYFDGFASKMIEALSSFYIGYSASMQGSLIGGLLGFIDAFVGGIIVAWIYNLCNR